MDETARRRSLYLFIAIVAVLLVSAIYVVRGRAVVSQRKQWLQKHYTQAPFNETSKGVVVLVHGDMNARPTLRKLLGDQTISEIEVLKDTPKTELRAITQLFPEADITYDPTRPINHRSE